MLIHRYQASWATDFSEIKVVITTALQNLDIRLEHIGSTAVEHLAAKPIIDIDIVYARYVPFENVKRGLEQLGYYHHHIVGEREYYHRLTYYPRSSDRAAEHLEVLEGWLRSENRSKFRKKLLAYQSYTYHF